MSQFDPAAHPGLTETLTSITIAAAEAIRRVQADGAVQIKPDGSPVTKADQAAEAVIRDGLTRLVPSLPIISEEQEDHDKAPPAGSPYFLVDPLDGTREFIAGIDEYTVNIAIVANGEPVLGVIAAPAKGIIWRGLVGHGAERLPFSGRQAGHPQSIKTRQRPDGELIAMVSRSHLEARTQAYLAGFPRTQRIGCGSSVKFCRLAEGAADLYPRLAPTHDWDIAAGHAILTAAGGRVIAPDGAPLRYGSPELLIPAFLAFGDAGAARPVD